MPFFHLPFSLRYQTRCRMFLGIGRSLEPKQHLLVQGIKIDKAPPRQEVVLHILDASLDFPFAFRIAFPAEMDLESAVQQVFLERLSVKDGTPVLIGDNG